MKITADKIKLIRSFGRELSTESNIANIERIGGLFPRGFVSIVASMAGTGKTWFTEYLACKLSMGGNVLEGLAPRSKKMKSVIFAGETGTDLLNYRLAQTCWEYDSSRITAYNAVDMMLHNFNCMLNTPEGQENVASIIAVEKPDIVFIDTLISFHTLDESKQGEMTSLYTYLLRMAKVFNCAVIVNHHTRKRPSNVVNKKFTQDDIIGTSAGVRLCAAAFIIMAEDNGEGGSKMTVINAKNWDKKVPEFSYEFVENENGKIDFKISFDTNAKNLLWSNREKFNNLIRTYPAGTLLKVPDLSQELGMSSETTRYYAEDCVKKGLLTKTKVLSDVAYTVMKR